MLGNHGFISGTCLYSTSQLVERDC